jgi:hypothetical protein
LFTTKRKFLPITLGNEAITVLISFCTYKLILMSLAATAYTFNIELLPHGTPCLYSLKVSGPL